MTDSDRERLVSILSDFNNRQLVVVGDAIADRFLYGSISRVSREAPVFILKHEQTETLPGGAANCALNLAALGSRVSLVSIVGDDEPGQTLKSRLESAGVNTDAVLLCPSLETVTKMRILAGQTHSSRQQVIRIDYEGADQVSVEYRAKLREHLARQLEQADAVIISDYNYGTVDDDAAALIRNTQNARRVPVLVDSRFRLTSFTGFTSATPNEDEVETLLGHPLTSELTLENAGRELQQQLGYESLLITRGGKGMLLLDGSSLPLHLPAIGGDQPVDVTGAGDTVIATFALALASGASYAEAATIANHAGGLVVMKRGTASVSKQELEHSILNANS